MVETLTLFRPYTKLNCSRLHHEITTIKREVQTYFHRSSKATEQLTSVLTRQNLESKKLIQDVDKRWKSTYYMFEHN